VNHQRIKPWTLILALTTATLLATACGGSSDSTPARPPGPSAPQELLARVEAPRSTANPTQANYANPELKVAFDRLNEMRLRAGIGALTQNSLVDKAAQLHSNYQSVNSFITHEEESGKPGFHGIRSADRIVSAGYENLAESTEVISSAPLTITPLITPAQWIDGLMGTPFHRGAMLRPQYADVGIGFASNARSNYLTVNFANTLANMQGAPDNDIIQDHLILWPPSGMTDLPTVMGCENPNPIKENGNGSFCSDRRPAGYPASVQVNKSASRSISTIVQFEMREKATGTLVDTKLLADSQHAAEPALAALMGTQENRVADGYYDGNSFAAILPKTPLKRNTQYEITFVGNVLEARVTSLTESRPVTGYYDYPQVRKVWVFTTGDKLEY
jgi:uncharacterized protein YkwD